MKKIFLSLVLFLIYVSSCLSATATLNITQYAEDLSPPSNNYLLESNSSATYKKVKIKNLFKNVNTIQATSENISANMPGDVVRENATKNYTVTVNVALLKDGWHEVEEWCPTAGTGAADWAAFCSADAKAAIDGRPILLRSGKTYNFRGMQQPGKVAGRFYMSPGVKLISFGNTTVNVTNTTTTSAFIVGNTDALIQGITLITTAQAVVSADNSVAAIINNGGFGAGSINGMKILGCKILDLSVSANIHHGWGQKGQSSKALIIVCNGQSVDNFEIMGCEIGSTTNRYQNSEAIYLLVGAGCTVNNINIEGNYIHDTYYSGCEVFPQGAGGIATGIKFHKNTVKDCNMMGISFVGGSSDKPFIGTGVVGNSFISTYYTTPSYVSQDGTTVILQEHIGGGEFIEFTHSYSTIVDNTFYSTAKNGLGADVTMNLIVWSSPAGGLYATGNRVYGNRTLNHIRGGANMINKQDGLDMYDNYMDGTGHTQQYVRNSRIHDNWFISTDEAYSFPVGLGINTGCYRNFVCDNVVRTVGTTGRMISFGSGESAATGNVVRHNLLLSASRASNTYCQNTGTDNLIGPNFVEDYLHTIGSDERIVTLSANTTLEAGVAMYTATGSITLTLPSAQYQKGLAFVIKDVGVGTITIGTTSSQTIDGALTKVLNTLWSSCRLVSDGSNWFVQ